KRRSGELDDPRQAGQGDGRRHGSGRRRRPGGGGDGPHQQGRRIQGAESLHPAADRQGGGGSHHHQPGRAGRGAGRAEDRRGRRRRDRGRTARRDPGDNRRLIRSLGDFTGRRGFAAPFSFFVVGQGCGCPVVFFNLITLL